MDQLEAVSELERRRANIDRCCKKLDDAIMALWEVRGAYRTDLPCLNSYVQTAYTAIATIQIELQNHKARISEQDFSEL
jgi:hypothetical protein